MFECIEQYAPGFKNLVIGRDILTPPDLERIFGLTGGNIFHGAMSVDQLYFARPSPLNTGYASRGVEGLFLCGSGAHPGMNVIDAATKACATIFCRWWCHGKLREIGCTCCIEHKSGQPDSIMNFFLNFPPPQCCCELCTVNKEKFFFSHRALLL